MAPKKRAQYLDLEEPKLYLKYWAPFLGAILGVKLWHHFWVHFSTPLWGTEHGAKFAKVFAPKAAWQIFFQQTCITKCICSHC